MVSIGDKIEFKGQRAVVRFVGKTHFATGTWVGLELETPNGKNNGSIQGVEYFKCQQPGNYGVFVRPSLLESKLPTSANVPAIVNRLQQKLRDVSSENSSLCDCVQELTQEVTRIKSEHSQAETELEAVVVESEYLKTQNCLLTEKFDALLTKYDELSAEYSVLKEELDIYKELEDAVRLQMPSEDNFTAEDFAILVQHNTRLELAYSSMEKLLTAKEKSFSAELRTLKEDLAVAKDKVKSHDATLEKLLSAETSIRLLQEQLESSLELVLVVERLTTENEALNSKVSELKVAIKDLSELNEIDKALESEHLQKESELQKSIQTLKVALETEKEAVAGLLISNRELNASVKQTAVAGDFGIKDSDVELLTLEIDLLRSRCKDLSANDSSLRRLLTLFEKFSDRIIPLEYTVHFIVLFKASFLLEEVESSQPKNVPESLWWHLKDVLKFTICLITYSFEILNMDSPASQFGLLISLTGPTGDSLKTVDTEVLLDCILSLETVLLNETPNFYLHVYRLIRFKSHAAMTENHFRSLSDTEGMNTTILAIIFKCQDLQEILNSPTAQCELAYFDADLDPDILLVKNLSLDSPDVFQAFLDKLDVLHKTIVACEPTISQNITSFYDILASGSSTKDKQSLDLLQAELQAKNREILDLELHVDLLEKNMALSLASKDAQIEQDQTLLADTQRKLSELQQQMNDVKQQNLGLERQVERFFGLDNKSRFHQTQFFEEKIKAHNVAFVESLAEEIQLLKKMLLPQLQANKWSRNIDWLHEPLYSKKEPSKGRHFLQEAHLRRKQMRSLLKAIPKATSNSRRYRYLQPEG